MTPLLVAGAFVAGCAMTKPRATRSNVGAVLSSTSKAAAYRLRAPAGPGTSPVLKVPTGARLASVYDAVNAGASVFAKTTTLRVEHSNGSALVHLRGPDLLEIGAAFFLPPGSARLVIYNGSGPANTPPLEAMVLFHT